MGSYFTSDKSFQNTLCSEVVQYEATSLPQLARGQSLSHRPFILTCGVLSTWLLRLHGKLRNQNTKNGLQYAADAVAAYRN
mmetsp:Transcript_11100/g.23518  ORF Transcript_11100/g.23518 Transcript_11100/m.23518 type:complete len:81 (-) Transcript_11100:387-629(-)